MRIRAEETDPLDVEQAARDAPTVADGLGRFFDEFAPTRQQMGRFSERTVKEYRWIADRFVEPALGRFKVADVTRVQVEQMVATLPGAQRNRVLAFASRVFSLAAAAGLADVRLHDLRRTVMTRAAAAGVSTHVLRDLLGHKTTAMADRYNPCCWRPGPSRDGRPDGEQGRSMKRRPD